MKRNQFQLFVLYIGFSRFIHFNKLASDKSTQLVINSKHHFAFIPVLKLCFIYKRKLFKLTKAKEWKK